MSEESKAVNAASLAEVAHQRDEARQEAAARAAQEILRKLNEEGDTPQEASDDENRKAHEKAEEKRRKEWEEKRQSREDEIQFAWEEAVALSDQELAAASVKRLGDMTERLTRRNMKICVTENIQTLCYEDTDFARLVMHPRKSMINCFKYINRKALEYLKEEMKVTGEKNQGTIGGDVPDELCYQWAEEYFRDLNAHEDKTDDDKEFVPKPYDGKKPSGRKKPEKKATEKKASPKTASRSAPAQKPKAESAVEDENDQLALF